MHKLQDRTFPRGSPDPGSLCLPTRGRVSWTLDFSPRKPRPHMVALGGHEATRQETPRLAKSSQKPRQGWVSHSKLTWHPRGRRCANPFCRPPVESSAWPSAELGTALISSSQATQVFLTPQRGGGWHHITSQRGLQRRSARSVCLSHPGNSASRPVKPAVVQNDTGRAAAASSPASQSSQHGLAHSRRQKTGKWERWGNRAEAKVPQRKVAVSSSGMGSSAPSPQCHPEGKPITASTARPALRTGCREGRTPSVGTIAHPFT